MARFECRIKEDGTAEFRRIIHVEAFNDIDTLDTTLIYPDAATMEGVHALEIIDVRPLNGKTDAKLTRLRRESIETKQDLLDGEEVSLTPKDRVSQRTIFGDPLSFVPDRLW